MSDHQCKPFESIYTLTYKRKLYIAQKKEMINIIYF